MVCVCWLCVCVFVCVFFYVCVFMYVHGICMLVVCVTVVFKPTGLFCPVHSVVFGLFQICDLIKSRPTINICNISINMSRQNNYVSAACYGTKCSLLFQ